MGIDHPAEEPTAQRVAHKCNGLRRVAGVAGVDQHAFACGTRRRKQDIVRREPPTFEELEAGLPEPRIRRRRRFRHAHC